MKLKLVLILLVISLGAKADEGMWMPYLLGRNVYEQMVKNGLHLTKEQLYSINKPSVKDAVVLFGNGCSGGIVSKNGLLLSNYHCAYSSLLEVSNAVNNYVRNGYYAHTAAEEIPLPGLSVQFLVEVRDVTVQLKAATEKLSGAARSEKLRHTSGEIIAAAVNGTDYEANIVPVFGGTQQLLFIVARYKDIRLVGVPDQTIGGFGAISDNWEWPRHTGDYAVFRVYTGADGRSAPSKAGNIPLKPKYVLPVSIAGVHKGDFTLVMGYPGNTDRNVMSCRLQLKKNVENPAIMYLRNLKREVLYGRVLTDTLAREQLAPAYVAVNNDYKYIAGENEALLKNDVVSIKAAFERSFQQWSRNKPAYRELLQEYAAHCSQWEPGARHRIFISDGIFAPAIVGFVARMQPLTDMLGNPRTPKEDIAQAMDIARVARNQFIAHEDTLGDRKILAATCYAFYRNIPAEEHPKGFYEQIAQTYGDLDDPDTYTYWAKAIMRNSIVLNTEKWKNFLAHPDLAMLQQDSLLAYCNTFRNNYLQHYREAESRFFLDEARFRQQYQEALAEMESHKDRYPDANNTMRVSFGTVQPYTPRNAVKYDYTCTVQGVLEKYIPGDLQYNLSETYRQRCLTKDFGRYKDKESNDLVTSFITTNDVTGGNSGSPVLNADGALIGIVCDNNYEGLDHKYNFGVTTDRAICVDIRYILWCIDKLGGATEIVKELSIVSAQKTREYTAYQNN